MSLLTNQQYRYNQTSDQRIYIGVCVRSMETTTWTECLLAGQLAIKAAESNAECLDGTERVVEVHRKHILRDTTELHHDVVH